MKILELFSGYGTASFALKRLGIDYELVGYSDIDKYANQCFKQNHCPDDVEDKLRLGDVTKINPYDLPDFDLLTGGFPCQAFSVAGKGLGELDTRGTLFNEIIRIAEVKKPRYMLLENVKGLTTKKHKATFDKILSELDRIGYVVKWTVLNSKEHGIPQNRERVFFVCKLGSWDFMEFNFPKKTELKIFLKDLLDERVDSKYYLKDTQIEKIIKGFERKGISWCVDTGNTNGVAQPLFISSTQKNNTIRNDGVSNCLPEAMGKGGGHTPMIEETCIPVLTPDRINKRQNGRRFKEDGDPSFTITSQDRHGVAIGTLRTHKDGEGFREVKSGLCPTIPARAREDESGQPVLAEEVHNCVTTAIGRAGNTSEYKKSCHKVWRSSLQIRRLTPKECFRLMGFLNDEINLDGHKITQVLKACRKYINLWETKSNVRCLLAQEKHKQRNMETFASFTIKENIKLEQQDKPIESDLQETLNVDIVITKLEKQERKDYVTNTIKCGETTTEMLHSLIKESLDQKSQDTQDVSMVVQHTKSSWKVTLKDLSKKEKLFIISMVTNLIIQSQIFSYVKAEANILISIDNWSISQCNLLSLGISSLKMEYMSSPLSDTQCYKLAGNGQSVNVVEKIFKEMFKQ